MDTEPLAASPIGKSIVKVLGAAMESRFRYRFFGPARTLQGAGLVPGQTVLEVGCGTGFYTIRAVHLRRQAQRRVHLQAVGGRQVEAAQ